MCDVFYLLPSVLLQVLTWSHSSSLGRLNKRREEEGKMVRGEEMQRRRRGMRPKVASQQLLRMRVGRVVGGK